MQQESQEEVVLFTEGEGGRALDDAAAAEAPDDLAGEAVAAVLNTATSSTDLVALFRLILAEQSAQQQASLATVIQELRRPDAKAQAEAERDLIGAQARIASQQQRDARQADVQAYCRHTMPNGKTLLRGSAFSNNCGRAFCSECHWLSGWFTLAPHEMTAPMDMHNWPNAFAMVQQRVRQSAITVTPPIPELPPGGRVIMTQE